jgi:hypothetical protein
MLDCLDHGFGKLLAMLAETGQSCHRFRTQPCAFNKFWQQGAGAPTLAHAKENYLFPRGVFAVGLTNSLPTSIAMHLVLASHLQYLRQSSLKMGSQWLAT